jgi:hypothetical protein
MNNQIDLLDHPDLSKIWVALEAKAPTLELDDIPAMLTDPAGRRLWSGRRILTLAAVFLMVVFVGTETFGVFSARRAIASGVVVADGVVEVDITVKQLSEPWADLEAPLGLHDLELRPEGIVAIASESDGEPESWLLGAEGWTSIVDVEYPVDWGAAVDNGLIAESATNGQTTVFAGYRDSLLSVDGTPTLWTSDSDGGLQAADMPSLRPLGFGYLIGGFRLPDGIEHVIHAETGFVAYTGYLQVWDGFEGLTLEPREAWSSLVVTSTDGQEWTPHVLSDLAIYKMVPFGNGILAAAALPPESDTVTVDVDGVATEVAVITDNRLFYSEDGLTWEAIADSPTFGKPLLAPTSAGSVIVVDEYQAEAAGTSATKTFIVNPPATTS